MCDLLTSSFDAVFYLRMWNLWNNSGVQSCCFPLDCALVFPSEHLGPSRMDTKIEKCQVLNYFVERPTSSTFFFTKLVMIGMRTIPLLHLFNKDAMYAFIICCTCFTSPLFFACVTLVNQKRVLLLPFHLLVIVQGWYPLSHVWPLNFTVTKS